VKMTAERVRSLGFIVVGTRNLTEHQRGTPGTAVLDQVYLGDALALDTTFDALTTVIELPNGFRLGIVAWTELMNNAFNFANEEDRVIIDDVYMNGQSNVVPKSKNPLWAQVKRSHSLDALVASVHWGREWNYYPDWKQHMLSERMILDGFDVVAGHHPHVVQTCAVVNRTARGHPQQRGMVAYSLGDFIGSSLLSTRGPMGCIPTLQVELERADRSSLQMDSPLKRYKFNFMTLGPVDMGFFKSAWISVLKKRKTLDWAMRMVGPDVAKCNKHLSTIFAPGVNGEVTWGPTAGAEKEEVDPDAKPMSAVFSDADQ